MTLWSKSKALTNEPEVLGNPRAMTAGDGKLSAKDLDESKMKAIHLPAGNTSKN